MPRCTAGWGTPTSEEQPSTGIPLVELVVDEVTALFRSNRKDEAAQIIPDAVVDDSAIVGDLDHVREQIKVWESCGVTMMLVSPGSVAEVEQLAELIR